MSSSRLVRGAVHARDLLDDRLGFDLGWGTVYGLVSGAALSWLLFQDGSFASLEALPYSLSVVAALGAFWTTCETRERALRPGEPLGASSRGDPREDP